MSIIGEEMIYWLTGKAGSGKTTLSRLLAKHKGAVVIDGDDLREGGRLGFSQEDREENARRALSLALIHAAYGKTVIVALMQPPPPIQTFYLTGEERHKEEWGGERDYYRPPEGAITLDTKGQTVEESFTHLLREIENGGSNG